MFFPDGSKLSQLMILGVQITDIQVLPTPVNDSREATLPDEKGSTPILIPSRNDQNPGSSQEATNGATSSVSGRSAHQNQDSYLVDPAILSYTKEGKDRKGNERSTLQDVSARPFVGAEVSRTQVSATLTKPFDALTLQHPKLEAKVQSSQPARSQLVQCREVAVEKVNDQARTKPWRKRKIRQAISTETPDRFGPTESQEPQVLDRWRQAPVLQPANDKPTNQKALGSRPGKSKKSTRDVAPAANGWATEDATDVQEMGDFDFAGNLSRFDKVKVFEEIRNGDTTADEDLLVTHNRLKRPGTFDGSKFHPSENVLPRGQSLKEVSFESEGDNDEQHPFEARQIPRNPSRASIRQLSFQSSARVGDISSANVPAITSVTRTGTPLSITSPMGRDSDRRLSLSQADSRRRRPRFHYLDTDATCPTLSVDTLREIEEIAIERDGLDPDILADRAGRGIAQTILRTINPGGRRLHQENHNSSPVVVILLGDSEAGASAIAAGTFLQERNVRVITSAVDGAASQDSEALRAQVRRFKGEILSWEATSKYLKTLDAPPELIVDGLVGLFNSCNLLQDFDTKSEQDTREMAAWANQSKASVLALDLPSGVDATSGEVRIREGEPVEIRAKIIACSGVPCVGLLRGMVIRSLEGRLDEWRIQVHDVGLNCAMKTVTQAQHPRNHARSVNFGTSWSVPIGFDAASV